MYLDRLYLLALTCRTGALLIIHRWFALVRHQPAWLGPRQGSSRFIVDQDAVLCCFLSCEGKTMALLAVSGIDNMSVTFRSTDKNTIIVHV